MPTWYLGRPGAMKALRAPGRDYDRSGSDAPQVIKLLAGQAVQRGTKICRTFKYSWSWATRSEWSTLMGIANRQYGPGPYALIDGATPNYLTENQASGGTSSRGTSGFTVSAGTLSTATTPVLYGDLSVKWIASGAASLTLAHPGYTTGYPTPAGVSWTLSTWLQSSATVTVTVALTYYNAAGTLLSETTGTGSVGTTGFTRVPVTGTTPATTAYVRLQIRVPSAVTLYVGAARLSTDNDASWYPGEGLPRVSVSDSSETVPIYDRRTVTLTLTEVS